MVLLLAAGAAPSPAVGPAVPAIRRWGLCESVGTELLRSGIVWRESFDDWLVGWLTGWLTTHNSVLSPVVLMCFWRMAGGEWGLST